MEPTRFVGLDVHKLRISVSVADRGGSGAVEYLGEIENEPGALGKLCGRLSRPGTKLVFCYEAGPCGYGVYRQLRSLGHRCDVVAPSLIPRKPRYRRLRARGKTANIVNVAIAREMVGFIGSIACTIQAELPKAV